MSPVRDQVSSARSPGDSVLEGASLHVPGTTFAIALPAHAPEARAHAVRTALLDARARLEPPDVREHLSAHLERIDDALSGRIAVGCAPDADTTYTYHVLEPGGVWREATPAQARWARRRSRVEAIGRQLEGGMRRVFWIGLALFAAQYLLVVVIVPRLLTTSTLGAWGNPVNPWWLGIALLYTAPWWTLYGYGAWLAVWVRLHAGKGVRL